MVFYSIGVYDKDEVTFFRELSEFKIHMFIDVRQRRGVRGKKYSFVNSLKLQEKLKNLNIKYLHIKELAPTNENRHLQKEQDKLSKTSKRKRIELSDVFKKEYDIRLSKFNFEKLISHIDIETNIVFFCVESKADACHRSLIINYLKEKFNYNVRHI